MQLPGAPMGLKLFLRRVERNTETQLEKHYTSSGGLDLASLGSIFLVSLYTIPSAAY